MIDFHAHVLPCIDDGPSSIEEALEILKMLKKQGVDKVVATPHYNDRIMDIEEFIFKRRKSYNELSEAIDIHNIPVPEIIVGAEVFFAYELILNDGLEKLCIGKTRCLLIEIPEGLWFDWICDLTDKLLDRNITPVIAHFERYAAAYKNLDRFEKIFEKNIYFQVNADSFLNKGFLRIIKKLDRQNAIHLIGSDAHNTKERSPKMDDAREKIIKKFGPDKWEYFNITAKKLLDIGD